MNELVEYNNTLNSLRFKDFTAMDYNVLMCLCYKLKDKGVKKQVFTFDELKKLTDFDNQNDNAFAIVLKRMIAKLIQVNATHIAGSKTMYFVLFPTFIVDEEKKTLSVIVNKDFTFILNDLAGNFTSFELKEFAELESKYAKSLYKNLKQYKLSGWWRPTVEELRIALDVPDTYSNKRIMGDILKPSLEILNDKFVDLKCEPIKAQKRGAPVERYYFTFQAEKQIRGQKTIADYPGVLPGEEAPKKIGKKNPFKDVESHSDMPKSKEEWAELEKTLIEN